MCEEAGEIRFWKTMLKKSIRIRGKRLEATRSGKIISFIWIQNTVSITNNRSMRKT